MTPAWHSRTPPAPDLGAGRPQHSAPDLRAGPGAPPLPDRPAQPAHRPDLHRQRRRGPSARRRPPRAGFADCRPGLFHRPGRSRFRSGTWSTASSRSRTFRPSKEAYLGRWRWPLGGATGGRIHALPAARRAAHDAIPGPRALDGPLVSTWTPPAATWDTAAGEHRGWDAQAGGIATASDESRSRSGPVRDFVIAKAVNSQEYS